MTDTTTAAPHHSGLSRLYTGTGGFDIIGRRKFYYLLTGGIVLVALLSMLIRGFSWGGIDFEGGTRIQMPAVEGVTVEQVETVYSDTLGTDPVAVQTVGSARARPSRSAPRPWTSPRSTRSSPRCTTSSNPPAATGCPPATRSASPTSARPGADRSPRRR